MTQGTITTTGNYPGNSGIQLIGGQALGADLLQPHYVSLSISGTPGTGASYQVTSRIEGAWVPVKGAVFSGNGAAATGHITVPAIGEAIRLEADNGSGAGTVKYTLNAYPIPTAHLLG